MRAIGRSTSNKFFLNSLTLTFRHFGWPCIRATSASGRARAQLAGGAREIEKQNEMCGAAQIKNESRSKVNLS